MHEINTESTTFTYNGLPVAWKKAGSGKPLVILHGRGSSSRAMVPLASHLNDIRTTCLIDLPGHVSSVEPPDAWSIDDYAEMTAAFIESLDAELVYLLPHSFGSMIAL